MKHTDFRKRNFNKSTYLCEKALYCCDIKIRTSLRSMENSFVIFTTKSQSFLFFLSVVVVVVEKPLQH